MFTYVRQYFYLIHLKPRETQISREFAQLFVKCADIKFKIWNVSGFSGGALSLIAVWNVSGFSGGTPSLITVDCNNDS